MFLGEKWDGTHFVRGERRIRGVSQDLEYDYAKGVQRP